MRVIPHLRARVGAVLWPCVACRLKQPLWGYKTPSAGPSGAWSAVHWWGLSQQPQRLQGPNCQWNGAQMQMFVRPCEPLPSAMCILWQRSDETPQNDSSHPHGRPNWKVTRWVRATFGTSQCLTYIANDCNSLSGFILPEQLCGGGFTGPDLTCWTRARRLQSVTHCCSCFCV